MSREVIPLMVVITMVLTALVGSIYQVNEVLRPKTAWEQKIVRADPVLYYEVGSGADPIFRLSGTERVMRFVTHAKTPTTGEPHDPRSVYDYGLRFELIDRSDEVFWSREIHTRTRKSKAESTPRGWLRENSFTYELDNEIWDDRLLYLTLSPEVPVNSRLRIRGVGDHHVLLRAYAQRERTPFQREIFLLRRAPLEPDDHNAVHVGSLRFDQLMAEERDELASMAWERMAAEGEIGRDYRTSLIYYDGFRLPFDQSGSPEGFIVGPSEPAVVNVVGPGEVEVIAQEPRNDPELIGKPAAERLTVTTRSGVMTLEQSQLALAAKEMSVRFEIGPGLHGLFFHVESGPVRVLVRALRPLPSAPTGVGSPGIAEPDLQRIIHFGAASMGMPVDLDVEPARDALERLFRVTLRAAVAADLDQGTGVIDIATFDAFGRELTRTTASRTAPRAPYERLMLTDGTRLAVTEPTNIRVLVPERATLLRVYPRQNAYVRVYLYEREVEPQVAPPYDEWVEAGWRWRYAPHLLERWLPVFPSNVRELTAVGQRVAMDAQIRPVPEPPPFDRASRAHSRRDVISIKPLRRPLQHFVMIDVETQDYGAFVDTWPSGTFARIEPKQTKMFDFGRGLPRSPRVDWDVEGSAGASLGRSLEILVDGVVVASQEIHATRGSLFLREHSRTTHTVAFQTDANLRVWIDRPPVLGHQVPLARVRTVYALGPQGLDVPVVTQRAERKVLNALIYAPGVEADPEVVIQSVVDGGVMSRVVGETIAAWTPARRVFTLPAANNVASTRFRDVRGVSPGYPRVVSIPIGDDVEAGRHIVHLSANRSLWACFFIYEQAEASEPSWVRSSKRSDP